MKFVVVLTCLLALASANEDAQVLRNDVQQDINSFQYAYELDNSVKAEQQGNLKGEDLWVVQGTYSYTSPEGEQISLQYTADENGYRVDSASPLLPTPPPIPEAIQRSLDYIAAHPPQRRK